MDQTPEQSRQCQALGKSRGGLSTKIHLVCDAQGVPVKARLSPGQESEFTHAPKIMEDLGGQLGFLSVAGDKGYDSLALRRQAHQELLDPVIAARKLASNSDQYPEYARGFDKLAYKGRNVVERLIGWLKEMRRIATRYDKLAANYLGFIYLGFIRIGLRHL